MPTDGAPERPARIVLVGAPGSGKGTQGVMLAKHFGVPYISTGQLLRAAAAAGTASGREIASYLSRGDLVPDALIVTSLRDALANAGPAAGYVLDGFPRTVTQARRLGELLAPGAVIHLVVPDAVARARVARRADPGRTDDDDEAVVERRLRQFHDAIGPILRYYRDRGVLRTVDADRPPDAVHQAVVDALADKWA
jgi:adenylate kinase